MQSSRNLELYVSTLIGIAMLATGLPSQANAGFMATISSNVSSLGAGLTEYQYTLTNSAQSTISAYGFALTVDKGAALQMINEPSGWSAGYTAGGTTITWSTATPLTPGNSAIFSFESIESPISSAYNVTGFDPTSFQFYSSPGSTLAPGPVTVPEPSSFLLSGISTLGVLVLHACNRRRRTAI